jgi:enamine deaminase RidA (YjgF/YER057c/UK114 family)
VCSFPNSRCGDYSASLSPNVGGELANIRHNLSFNDKVPTMNSPQQIAKEIGLTFTDVKPGYLNLCAKAGNLLFTSGHTSDMKGKLGRDLTVEQGYAAARECMVKILNSVHFAHGTLNGLRCVKLLGCVNSTLDFTDQHLVINGASDLVHQLYGKDGDGWHARSALGFASLPTGPAVEVEAIFEIKG